MKYVIGVIALFAVALLLLQIIGSRLPREHRASRSARVKGTPDDVFAAITDVERFPAWRPELKKVERLADVDGKSRYRETSDHGPLTFEVTESIAGTKRVTSIVDEGQPFGGRWTTELRTLGTETEVVITEDGFVNPPIFRVLSRYVFGQSATMETYLKNLQKHFDGSPS